MKKLLLAALCLLFVMAAPAGATTHQLSVAYDYWEVNDRIYVSSYITAEQSSMWLCPCFDQGLMGYQWSLDNENLNGYCTNDHAIDTVGNSCTPPSITNSWYRIVSYDGTGPGNHFCYTVEPCPTD